MADLIFAASALGSRRACPLTRQLRANGRSGVALGQRRVRGQVSVVKIFARGPVRVKYCGAEPEGEPGRIFRGPETGVKPVSGPLFLHGLLFRHGQHDFFGGLRADVMQGAHARRISIDPDLFVRNSC